MTEQITTGTRPQGARPQLLQEPGAFTAMVVGLGAMLGTGVFVALGIVGHIAGTTVALAVGVAALVAACSGHSVSRLATRNATAVVAASDVARDGPYEYGPKHLNSHLSFTAAWMFLCAKSASAATAALGIAGYILSAFGINNEFWRVGLGLTALVVVVGILLRTDISWSRLATLTRLGIAAAALLGIALFIAAGMPNLVQNLQPTLNALNPFAAGEAGELPAFLLRDMFHASALAFVAFVGFGRIGMLGGDLRRPLREIPAAVMGAILVALVLYLAVLAVGFAAVGAPAFADITLETWAPLEVVGGSFGLPGVGLVIAACAVLAMLGILLTLIQSLARLMLIMGRRKDMPNPVARVSKSTHVPETAAVTVGILISLLILIGDIRITWSLSAFTVLIYYAVVNLAVINLPAPKPWFSQAVATSGLLACLFLAFWVEPRVWLAGLLLIAVGHGWRGLMRRL